jgi:hypothetical protein
MVAMLQFLWQMLKWSSVVGENDDWTGEFSG